MVCCSFDTAALTQFWHGVTTWHTQFARDVRSVARTPHAPPLRLSIARRSRHKPTRLQPCTAWRSVAAYCDANIAVSMTTTAVRPLAVAQHIASRL